MELSIDELNNLANNNDELTKRNEKLVNALEEIREIADRLWSNKYQNVEEAENDVHFIQDKINEVL